MLSSRVIASPRRGVWKDRSGHRKRVWLILGAGVILFVALYCLISAIILMRVQETTPPALAAQLQERHGGLYGPAGRTDIAAYKLERYVQRRPDILIVGSQRLASLPGEAFTASVYNAAGVADSVEQLSAFVQAAVARHAPKSVLIGADYWWFHPDAPSVRPSASQDSGFAARLIDPLLWVVTGRISIGEFIDGVFPTAGAMPGIGALAVLDGQGWDTYGRYEGGLSASVGAGEAPLARNVHVGPSTAALQQLQALIAELNGRSIEVVLIIPPASAPLHLALATDSENRLLPLWRDALRSLGQKVFDFEDPSSLGATDCEFINDISGGEVAYLRALDAIGNYGGTAISQGIDRDLTASLIASNAGHIRIGELLPADAPTDIERRSDCDQDM
ncbi:MAG: hypothetical protein HYU58_19680 [Proteobacteria bacterium]|nr:hypothetical protein [Pseudomonadota bacterium]